MPPEALAPWATAGIWGFPLSLIVLYAAFKLFNLLAVRQRRFVFPVLHLVKNFAGALILPLTPLGTILLFSQWVSQVALYLIHRGPGGAATFNRHAFRAMIFAIVLSIGVFLRPTDTLEALRGAGVCGGVMGMQAALIFGWLLFRSLQRAYGRGLLRIFRGRLV